MITLKEIRARQQRPYKLEDPYYKPIYYDTFGPNARHEKTYYDVHGGSAEEDVTAFIQNMPDALQEYISITFSRLPGYQQTTEYKMKCIDVTFFMVYGEFAP